MHTMAKMAMISFVRSTRPTRLLILPIFILLLSFQVSIQADFIDLNPNTTGYFTADTTYAWNNTSSLGNVLSTMIGSTQGLLANKEHRSYMIFDTYQVNSGIISASIRFGVSSWYNSRGGQPTGTFSINVGLPTGFTAADYATNYPMYTSTGMPLYQSLDTYSIASVPVTVAPNTAPVSGQVVWYTVNLPLGFISAFNQTRLNGSRYLTLSVTATNPSTNKAEISQMAPDGTVLRVNTISSTPEPVSMISLAVGLGLIFVRKRFCKA